MNLVDIWFTNTAQTSKIDKYILYVCGISRQNLTRLCICVRDVVCPRKEENGKEERKRNGEKKKPRKKVRTNAGGRWPKRGPSVARKRRPPQLTGLLLISGPLVGGISRDYRLATAHPLTPVAAAVFVSYTVFDLLFSLRSAAAP